MKRAFGLAFLCEQACFHTCSFSVVEMMGISHSLSSCSFPQSLRSSGEFLKTIHRMVFLTEFHPNGFDPCNSVRTKKQACFHTCSFFCGGDDGDRTHGLSIANAALSQLSYIPKVRI